VRCSRSGAPRGAGEVARQRVGLHEGDELGWDNVMGWDGLAGSRALQRSHGILGVRGLDDEWLR
jgi:hypothetical protein